MTLLYHAVGSVLKRKGRADRTPSVPNTGRPSGTGYVTYESLYTTGNTLQQVLNKVTGSNVLTFPEGEFTFDNFANGYYEGVRVPAACGGIWGSGRNTIFKMTPGTSNKANDTTAVPPSSGTNQCYLIGSYHSGPVYRNFQLLGTDQGHYYNGMRLVGTSGARISNVLIRDVFFNGCYPGYANYPPGETFGFGTNWTDNVSLINCEFDGRHPTSRVKDGGSPFGWNNSTNAYVENVYAHHSKTGMPTFYATTGVHTVGLRAEYNGTGGGVLSAAGINHENVAGTVLHESPTLLIDRAGGNTDLHITLQNGIANNPDVTLTNVVHDAGPNTAFSVMISDGYVDPQGRAQKQTSLPTITKAGAVLTARDANAGNSNPDTATQFFRYH